MRQAALPKGVRIAGEALLPLSEVHRWLANLSLRGELARLFHSGLRARKLGRDEVICERYFDVARH
jgi:hypothetical protein